MKNKISDLRDHLFESIERLKDGDMDVPTAKAISDVAQTIINSAKLELQFEEQTQQLAAPLRQFMPSGEGQNVPSALSGPVNGRRTLND